MKQVQEHYDLVVCGGGLAGFCAAVAAARRGVKTCLIHDRPVFGGNSSSEIRVPPHGAACFHAYARETGIISELLIEERARNHEIIRENGWTNSVWDMVMYDMAVRTPNLTFHLNTSVVGVRMSDGQEHFDSPPPSTDRLYYHRPACNTAPRIAAVICRVASAETELRVVGRLFIDCTGDAVVADLAGCEWRMGSEGREEFGEIHAPETPSTDTMGDSIHFKARDIGAPAPFKAPEWAVRHRDADYFYKQGRVPYDINSGFWWIEIGVPWNTIHDAETIRHELTRHCLGIWDWMKNRDEKTRGPAANFALDWIGQVPGKRESRRVIGRYFMTEHDIQNKTVFPDEIAYGGWFVDLHTPGGLLADKSEPASAEGYEPTSDYAAKSYCGPYGIPLRILIAKDVENLMMAGRNVSVTHAALGTVRVMATTALMGQAAGVAASIALARNTDIAVVPEQAAGEVQQALLRDDCFLPNVTAHDPADLAQSATASASSEAMFYGAGPEDRWAHGGIEGWRTGRLAGDQAMIYRRGQWIAVAATLDRVSLCLTNSSDQPQTIEGMIVPVDHIWDYRAEPGRALARTTLTIPPGQDHWIDWDCGVKVARPGYVRLDVLPNAYVQWLVSPAFIPGHTSAYQHAPGRMRRYGNGVTNCLKVAPPQPVFGAANVLTGENRPHLLTNVWRSDPAQPLPQWLRLQWPRPHNIRQVELTFPGNVLCEYHACPPFYRDPQTAREYAIEAMVDGQWCRLAYVKENYQRHRVHTLDRSVITRELRVVIIATNGDPSAAIAQVRCYA